MKVAVVAWLLASIAFEVAGDIFAKRASGGGGWPQWALSAIAYNLMLLCWFVAVSKAKAITVPGIVWLLCGQLALVAVGCGMFGEHLTAFQKAGCGLAAVSLILLSL